MKNKSRQYLYFLAFSVLVTALAAIWLKPITRSPGAVSPIMSCLSGPKFADHPVLAGDVYLRYPTPVDFTGQTEAWTYRSFIRTSVARGVNYAGHYVVAEWGCGTNCQDHAIIDAKTGKIVMMGLKSNFSIDYRKDSTLLVVDPHGGAGGLISPRYFVADGGTIKSLCD